MLKEGIGDLTVPTLKGLKGLTSEREVRRGMVETCLLVCDCCRFLSFVDMCVGPWDIKVVTDGLVSKMATLLMPW